MKYTVDREYVICGEHPEQRFECYADTDAAYAATELNRLLAERDEARRELKRIHDDLDSVNWAWFREKAHADGRVEDGLAFDSVRAALSRCTPPATCPNRSDTNG